MAYQRFRFGQALGGGDSQAALREVAADLSYAVSYANDIGGELDTTMRRRIQMLTKVVALLPEGTDLAPLLELNPNAMPYSVAFDLVQKRAKLDWLIESSCNSSEDGRKFAAAVEWTLPEQPGYSKFEIRLVRGVVPRPGAVGALELGDRTK